MTGSANASAEPPAGCADIGGRRYMRDAKGALVPIEVVRAADKLQDELVRAISARAAPVSEALASFKRQAFADVDAFVELLAGEYSTAVGGSKGNMTLTTYDGLMRVQVQVADRVVFGPELQVAKTIVDECLNGWSAEAGPELRAIVTDAFKTDKEGEVSATALFRLLRYDIKDERWVRGMQAIRDSIRVEGSRRYVRLYRREAADARWEAVSLDLASA